MTSPRIDVYTRVTDQIVAELEAGVRPWVQPWNAAHAAGEVSRPLRFNRIPYPLVFAYIGTGVAL